MKNMHHNIEYNDSLIFESIGYRAENQVRAVIFGHSMAVMTQRILYELDPEGLW